MSAVTAGATDQNARPLRTGRHRIEAELGRGGMGAVYRAVENGTGRVVALKTLELTSPATLALFEREYHTLASLTHPSVIAVYDFGIAEDGRRYYTMELLEGDDVAALAPVPWRKACEYLRDVAASLALLHARRLVHRDVSPRNIRLDAVGGRAKLLDFGALTPFGVATDIVGTPACIAPEGVRQLALDQRTDLFSLGVVAYWMLTGNKPFAIRNLRDVEGAHRPPPPLSAQKADIPRALDQLVLSLISLEPQARPGSAAEVIERLGAIADLGDEPLAGVVESHFLSTALCGREREKAQLTRHLQNALGGQGGVVILEGAAGMGRSRLASELLIDARLAGLTTLRVEALAHSEPNGVLRALARLLLQTAPAEATETLAAHLPVLRQAFEELEQQAIVRPPSHVEPLPQDPAERRARIQTAFVQWLLAVAERRPMAIVVDDAHGCDAGSAGALVALGHAAQRTRLLLLTTQRLGAEAPIAIQQLARIGARIKLRGLSQPATAQLVGSAFGEVPNQARLTQWLWSVGHGNPAQSLELLANLVGRGVIRYAGGAWELPAVLSERDLPASLEEALGARLSQLGHNALELAQLFALHQGSLTLALCNELLPDVTRAKLFAALDELLLREIVAASGESYRLRQEALRPLLLQPLAAERVRTLHLALAHAQLVGHRELLEPGAHPEWAQVSSAVLGILLQAGWHLLRGGDEESARELLRNAGIELTHRGDGLADAVPALEATLEVYRRQGRSHDECAYLMVPLTLAGAYGDFRLCYRYASELLLSLQRDTGIELSRRLSRFLGLRLSLLVALGVAFVRFSFIGRNLTARNFRELLLGVISIGSAVIGTAVVLLDRVYAQQVLDWLQPLSAFPRKHAARLAYEFQVALVDGACGRYDQSRKKGRRVLQQLQRSGGVPGMPEDARIQLAMGALILLGSLDVNRVDGSVHETLDALDRLRSAVSRQTAAGLRAGYHAGRGEQTRFEQYQREVDVLAAQAGSTWRQDVLIPRTLWWTYTLCEDVMGLKRCVRQLETIAEEAPSLAVTRDATRACYLAERGRPEEALAQYGEMLETEGCEATVISLRYAGAHARILRRVGQPQRAREVCDAALSRATPEQLEFVLIARGVHLELALAMAELGETVQAAASLEVLLDGEQKHDNPLIHGLTHKARAHVALLASDAEGFDRHLKAMFDWFHRTQNPALLAQCQQLADEGRRRGLIHAGRRYSAQPAPNSGPDVTAVRRAFGDCRGPVERVQAALDLVIAKAGAERGYLYVLEPAGLRFAAPSIGLEPPEELQHELSGLLERLKDEEESTVAVKLAQPGELRTVVHSEGDSPLERQIAGQPYRALLLLIPRESQWVAVGAIALVQGDEPLTTIGFGFLEEVARGIYDAGDVQTVHVAAAR